MALFIAGLFTAVLLIGLCGASYYFGTKHAHKAILEPVDAKKRDAMAEHAEGMNKILNYDVGMALKSRGGSK
jgi:hypothetical protein